VFILVAADGQRNPSRSTLLTRVEKKILIDVQFLQEESVRRVALEHIGELFPQEVHTTASIIVFTIESFFHKFTTVLRDEISLASKVTYTVLCYNLIECQVNDFALLPSVGKTLLRRK